MPNLSVETKSKLHYLLGFVWIAVGAFLAAFSLEVFLVPNKLIDGGIIGVAMILARLVGSDYLSYFSIMLNLPFLYLAYRHIRKSFVIHFLAAVLFFAFFILILQRVPAFRGDILEILVLGGALLGIGVGLMIRYGGCVDGAEILAIIVNRKKGFTVGQVVFAINAVVFVAYGLIFKDWHIALYSLMLYIVAFKMMDLVIVGLDEIKSVMVISSKPKELGETIMSELGLGLTFMHGRGGFSGDAKEILFIIVERLDLADLKEIILKEDPSAFIAIENLHEVVYGKHAYVPYKKKRVAVPKKRLSKPTSEHGK